MANRENVSCLGKPASLQVTKAWLEILDTSGSRWAYWSTPQKKLSEIFHKHRINTCTGLNPPYEKSRAGCRAFLEAAVRLPPHLDLDIRGWAGGGIAPCVTEQALKAFLSRGETGVKDLIVNTSKKLLAMLTFLDSKLVLGEDVLLAHERYITSHHLALQTQGGLTRGEYSRSQGLQNIKRAISDIHTLFNASRTFLLKRPDLEAAEGITLAFGNHPPRSTFNFAHIQQVLELVGAHSPRVVMYYLPMVGTLEEEQPFASLIEKLQELYNSVAALDGTRGDGTLTAGGPMEDIEGDHMEPHVGAPWALREPGSLSPEFRTITQGTSGASSLPFPEDHQRTREHSCGIMSTSINKNKAGSPV